MTRYMNEMEKLHITCTGSKMSPNQAVHPNPARPNASHVCSYTSPSRPQILDMADMVD